MKRFIAAVAGACALATALPAFADDAGAVRGVVVRDGRPVPRAVVHLYGASDLQTAVTGTDGRFAFARVRFGHYTLHANAAGEPAVAEVDIASGSIVQVTLSPIPVIGRTQGTTRTVRGTPVSENAIGERAIATLPRGDSLNAIVQTVPGIVPFSYNEPVAHGFHGLTYELDGAPLPQSTSSNFSELVDPRSVAAVEVFTGAFPAEYGGARQGAVINVVSRAPAAGARPEGSLTVGAGTFGARELRWGERVSLGAVAASFSLNESSSDRGIDAPTPDAALAHDRNGLSDQFLRLIAPVGPRSTLAFDLSNQFATYQIPINTASGDPNDAFVSVPGTDDVQRETDRFASLSFAHASRDGLGFVQVVPWVRASRIAYDGDLAKDVLAVAPDPATGAPVAQNGLRQDRRATDVGVRASVQRSSDIHAVKAGLDLSRETFSDDGFIALAGGAQTSNAVHQAGALAGAYVQDRWALGQRFALNYGLRYDRSTGFTGGAQLSPRLECNYSPDPTTVFHAYAGRLYAAPSLEDTRKDAIVTRTYAGAAPPPYDLQPERDSYVEVGIAHTFRPGFSMYANAWQRNARNVLDTTQLANTPLFAVFNNAVGHANGLELRIQDDTPRQTFFLSAATSQALAGGISGSTFLFPPSAASDLTLNPEDHDQAVTLNAAYTRRFADDRGLYLTIAPSYGTGYPVTFQDGSGGRLPPHLTFDVAIGREADGRAHRAGVQLAVSNLFDKPYLIKVNNGFNTTQWAAGRRVMLRLTAPF